VFDALISRLAEEGTLEESGARLRLSDHEVKFSDEQQSRVNALLKQFGDQPYTPPSLKQSIDSIGEELVAVLIDTDQLVQLGEDVVFTSEVLAEMRQAVIDHIKKHGEITLAELRDRFDTSRKYAVAVLEYLDQSGVTIRRGDIRQLRR